MTHSHHWFRRIIERYPLIVNSSTALGCMSVGDAVAQYYYEPKFEWKRNVVVSAWNGFVFAPVFYFWFGFLDKKIPGSGVRQVLKKVTINQLVLTIPLNATFMAYTLMTENFVAGVDEHVSFPKMVEQVKSKINRDIWKIFMASVFFWCPVNAFNFLIVPKHYRVMPTIAASFVWSTFLSAKTHERVYEESSILKK